MREIRQRRDFEQAGEPKQYKHEGEAREPLRHGSGHHESDEQAGLRGCQGPVPAMRLMNIRTPCSSFARSRGQTKEIDPFAGSLWQAGATVAATARSGKNHSRLFD